MNESPIKLKELSIEDLKKQIWTYESSKTIGQFQGKEIKLCNFWATDAQNPDKVLKVNLNSKWIEELSMEGYDPLKYATDDHLKRETDSYKYINRIEILETTSFTNRKVIVTIGVKP